jgi:hypothetical protein
VYVHRHNIIHFTAIFGVGINAILITTFMFYTPLCTYKNKRSVNLDNFLPFKNKILVVLRLWHVQICNVAMTKMIFFIKDQVFPSARSSPPLPTAVCRFLQREYCVWSRVQDKWTANLYGASSVREEWITLHWSSRTTFLCTKTTGRHGLVCGI